MRRFIAAILALCIIATFCACGARPAASVVPTSQDPTAAPAANDEELTVPPLPKVEATESQGIEVDENLMTVEVTLPASYFEDETPEEITAGAKDAGMISCVVNDDGSVTYKMTKAKHRELLSELKAEIDNSINDMLTGDTAIASFKSVEYSDDMTQFKVFVDADQYTDWDSLYVMTFYLLGGYYQAFCGISSQDVEVIVQFIDEATGEVLDTGSLQDFLAAE